jgi:endonuclease/exonuclease/phosphatase (EEP) superfamily protein YafD
MTQALNVIATVYDIVAMAYLVALLFVGTNSVAAGRAEVRGTWHVSLVLMLWATPVLAVLGLLGEPRVLSYPAGADGRANYWNTRQCSWPRRRPQPSGAPTLSILSFNIQAPRQGFEGLVEVIRQADADIVAVQELSAAAGAYFRLHLRDVYPYQAAYTGAHPNSGQGILSRYPLANEDYWPDAERKTPLGHLRAEVNVDGRRFVLYNLHPVPPFSMVDQAAFHAHSLAMQDLLTVIDQETGPVLLAGDFNMTNQFREYGWVRKRFRDALRVAGRPGLGFTYPVSPKGFPPPLIRLDYIFYNGSFRALDAHRWPSSGGSDHLPMWARLELLMAPTPEAPVAAESADDVPHMPAPTD